MIIYVCVSYICSNKMKALTHMNKYHVWTSCFLSSKNTCLSFSLSSCHRCFSCFCFFSQVLPSHLVNQSCLQSSHGQVAVFVWGDLRGQLLFNTDQLARFYQLSCDSRVFPIFNVSCSTCYQHTKCSIYLTITQFHCSSHNKSLG